MLGTRSAADTSAGSHEEWSHSSRGKAGDEDTTLGWGGRHDGQRKVELRLKIARPKQLGGCGCSIERHAGYHGNSCKMSAFACNYFQHINEVRGIGGIGELKIDLNQST